MTGRRAFLGGLMGVMYPHPARGRVAGGNPPIRPDQAAQLNVTRAGTGPAPQNLLVIARTVIVFGPTGSPTGVFVYAAGTTPGPGNPPIASMTNQTHDPFGNAVTPEISSQVSGLIAALHQGQAQFSTGFDSSAGLIGAGFGAGNAGQMSVQSPQTGAGDTFSVLTLASKNSSVGFGGPLIYTPDAIRAAAGIWALAGTASGSPPSGAEVFNDLGSTGLAGDTGSASYRLTAEGELQITVQKTFTALGGVTTATFATTLVAPYIPPAARILVGDPIKVNGGSPGSTTGLHLTTGGAVQLTGLPAGATGAGCDVRIPLF